MSHPNTEKKTIAIIGNPNCGKTVIFNKLTGARQRIGNWAGVTVEKKSGYCSVDNRRYKITDLPGIYSLSTTSDDPAIDECIACNYLVSHRPDLIINVIDASNFERQLYLTAQLLEMQIPIIIALNMMDTVKHRGENFHIAQLSQALGCPIIPLIAIRGKGISELRETLVRHATPPSPISYPLDPRLQTAFADILKKLSKKTLSASWLSLRLLEGDKLAHHHLSTNEKIFISSHIEKLKKQLNEEIDLLIADARYRWIQSIARHRTQINPSIKTLSSRLDQIVLNRYFGLPIFLLIMYALFLFSINVGGVFQDFFDIIGSTLSLKGSTLLNQLHAPDWLVALIAEGLWKGINTVISFVPVIGALFLFLSVLEDSGYMARAAFIVDKLMASIGLPGKAFVPLIVGFGCNVPAIMATRTLSSPRDRILTTMMVPFMSCGARLTVYTLFVAAFFPQQGAFIIFILYMCGILMAILTGFWLRFTVLKADATPMILELPNYHWPHWGTIFKNTWQRLKLFLSKSSYIIIPVCLILGFLNTITPQGTLINNKTNQNSLLSSFGKTVTPFFAPIGIKNTNWPATVGLLSGLLAKEVVVGTLNTLYTKGALEEEKREAPFLEVFKAAILTIPKNFYDLGKSLINPLASKISPTEPCTTYGTMAKYFDGGIGAFSYLLFILLYFPCISTMAVMRREIGKSWTCFSMIWSTGIAYITAALFYQVATLTRHPLQTLLWVFISVGSLLSYRLILKTKSWAALSTPNYSNLEISLKNSHD